MTDGTATRPWLIHEGSPARPPAEQGFDGIQTAAAADKVVQRERRTDGEKMAATRRAIAHGQMEPVSRGQIRVPTAP